MRKKIIALIAGLGLALSLAHAVPSNANTTGVSSAASSVTATEAEAPTVAYLPVGSNTVQGVPGYFGWRYLFKDICLHDIQMSSDWDFGWTGNTWEPAVVTGWRSSASGCNDYPAWQRMRLYQYSEPDGFCGKLTGTRTAATPPHPVNSHYAEVWTGTDGGPAIWLNLWYYAGCRDTATRRSNALSKLEGHAFGLNNYGPACGDNTVATASVLNTCAAEQYLRAGAYAKDRNVLTLLMNPS